MGHESRVQDTDGRFVIDTATKKITNDSEKTVLIQGEHNSQRFTFEIARFVDGHDMTECDRVAIHYENIAKGESGGKSSGVYYAADIQPAPDNENLAIFTWLVSNSATVHVGGLEFNIHFECLSEDKETVDYSWKTAVFSNISVLGSKECGDVVAELYPDALSKWTSQAGEIAAEQVSDAIQTARANGEFKAEKGDKGDPFTYEDFTEEQLKELNDYITQSKVLQVLEATGLVKVARVDDKTVYTDKDDRILLL